MDGDENGNSKGYLVWTQQMDEYLLEVLLGQKIQGQKPDRNFTSSAYDEAVEAINKHFPVKVNKEKVQHRLKTLKRHMSIALEVLNKRGSGFAWNDITKKIDATKPVWDALVKSYPEARKVRDVSIPCLNILRELFEKDRATGEAAESAKEKNRRWVREAREGGDAREFNIEEIDELLAYGDISLENLEENEELSGIQQSSSYVPSTSVSSKKGGKKKVTKSDELNNNIANMTDTMTKIADAFDKSNVVAQQGRRRVYSATEVWGELKRMDEVDMNFLFAASHFLVKDPTAAEEFFGCPAEFRKSWLMWRMNGNSS